MPKVKGRIVAAKDNDVEEKQKPFIPASEIISVGPLAAIYIQQIADKIEKRLTLKANIKSGNFIVLEHFIPFDIFSFIFRAIRDAKDPHVYPKVIEDKKTGCTSGFEVTYHNKRTFERHISLLAGVKFRGTRTHISNTVQLIVSRVEPLAISYAGKKGRLR